MRFNINKKMQCGYWWKRGRRFSWRIREGKQRWIWPRNRQCGFIGFLLIGNESMWWEAVSPALWCGHWIFPIISLPLFPSLWRQYLPNWLRENGENKKRGKKKREEGGEGEEAEGGGEGVDGERGGDVPMERDDGYWEIQRESVTVRESVCSFCDCHLLRGMHLDDCSRLYVAHCLSECANMSHCFEGPLLIERNHIFFENQTKLKLVSWRNRDQMLTCFCMKSCHWFHRAFKL